MCTAFYVHRLACGPLNNMTPAVATVTQDSVPRTHAETKENTQKQCACHPRRPIKQMAKNDVRGVEVVRSKESFCT